MNEENSLLTGAVRPALLRYALPIILSMVATQFYAVADTMIIGLRLDADALAAVSKDVYKRQPPDSACGRGSSGQRS